MTSAYYLQPRISDLAPQKAYAKVDLRAAIGRDDGRRELAVISRDVSDRKTAVFGDFPPGAPGSSVAAADRPRSAAVPGKHKWVNLFIRKECSR